MTLIRAILALFRPFAGATAVKNGMGPANEGSPSGWFH